jgi:hypothetical protein
MVAPIPGMDRMAEWIIDVLAIIETERTARTAQDACMADLRKRGVIR